MLKRLTHRNANVQLYSLAVAEALSKNCGIEVHRELASRAFTQGLEKLVTDRVCTIFGYEIRAQNRPQTGHDKVKKKTLSMIHTWAKEWENDPSLGIMNECYESLKTKSKYIGLFCSPYPLTMRQITNLSKQWRRLRHREMRKYDVERKKSCKRCLNYPCRTREAVNGAFTVPLGGRAQVNRPLLFQQEALPRDPR